MSQLASHVCPLCGGQTAHSRDVHAGPVFQCSARECHHLFRPDTTQADSLFDYASEEYNDAYSARNHKLVDHLEAHGFLTSGARVLDLGSGEGHVAACLRERGYEVLCVEPSPEARRFLTSRGLSSVPYADDIPEDQLFDFAYLIEVIEHIPVPTEALKAARARMRPGAGILVTTPSAKGLLARVAPERSNSFGVPSHIHYFTNRSLTRCLSDAGFVQSSFRYLHFMVPHASRLSAAVAYMLNRLHLGGSMSLFARA